MTSLATKRKSELEDLLSKNYRHVSLQDEKYFLTENNAVFHVDIFDSAALVIEYAESVEAAEKYQLEDGDRFYLSDYTDAGAMLDALLKEIRASYA